jgi:glycerophosphoryl diester phosphodiesterase
LRELPNSRFFKLPLPRAFGHRGSAGTHPENTLESFRAAAALGIEYLEFDLHMTRDGEIVVSHDDHLTRLCGREGVIRELTWSELLSADAGRMFTTDGGATFPFRDRGIKIPRLADVFAEFPAMRFLIEIKQTLPSLVAPMLTLVDRANLRSNVLIASEHQAPLDEVRLQAPDLPSNFSYFESGGFFQAMAARDQKYSPPGDALQIPANYESWNLVTADSVNFAHQLGIEVHVWTVNEVAEMNRLLDLGVDGLISDYPGRLLDVIRTRQGPAPAPE